MMGFRRRSELPADPPVLRPDQAEIAKQELRRLRRIEIEAARAAFVSAIEKRRAAIELPENPFRISRLNGHGVWIVEEAIIDDAVFRSLMIRDFRLHTVDFFAFLTNEENLAGCVYLRWKQLGPIKDGSADERLPFATFAEAEAWLGGYITPVSDVVYFTPEGLRA